MKEQAVMQLMSSAQRMPNMSRDRPQTEPLGTQTFDGFVATGSRNVTTYAAGAIGNDREFQVVSETWTSSDLGRAVLTKYSDPRNGDRKMQLINISKGDPDISFFQPPPGFKLLSAPSAAPAQPTVQAAPQTVPTQSEYARNSIAPRPAAAGIDTAQVLSVLPDERWELRDGQAVQFTVKLHYALRSVDQAILAVYAERYTSDVPSCKSSVHHTEGGTEVPIRRGEGDLTVRFPWHEDTGPRSRVPAGAAFLAIGANLWPDENGRTGIPMMQAFGTSFCRPVNP
jgi:hypothetical protein